MMARAMTVRVKPELHPISDEWDWQLRAKCRERDSAQFFHPDDDLGRISRRLREEAAKRVCEACPVRMQCATHALTVGEEYGVWGGFSEHDRSMLREVGWRDTLDRRRMADISRLERRLKRVRQRVERMKAGQPSVAAAGSAL
jgi:WhiB family transcriptional regulator, redox-sensing transcriptional regulator